MPGPLLAIDVFHDRLDGLLLAETQVEEGASLEPLAWPLVVREVTADGRFAGGALARTSARQLHELLGELSGEGR